jgi:paired amphipathic helix protein Sin3a
VRLILVIRIRAPWADAGARIDTPGVIERVSMLFQGNPYLIQGFNTFLPPGYHIECSQDPREPSITVTTPSGVFNQGGNAFAPLRFPRDAMGGLLQMPLTVAATAGAAVQPPPANVPPGLAPPPPPPGPFATGLPHALPPIGSGAASRPATPLASLTHPPPHHLLPSAFAHTPAPYSPGVPGAPSTTVAASLLGNLTSGNRGASMLGPGDAERPAGEFNHAIQYLNKIKTRFAEDANTYKQFLEILQAYQKDQRNLEDVRDCSYIVGGIPHWTFVPSLKFTLKFRFYSRMPQNFWKNSKRSFRM